VEAAVKITTRIRTDQARNQIPAIGEEIDLLQIDLEGTFQGFEGGGDFQVVSRWSA